MHITFPSPPLAVHLNFPFTHSMGLITSCRPILAVRARLHFVKLGWRIDISATEDIPETATRCGVAVMVERRVRAHLAYHRSSLRVTEGLKM